MTVPLLGVFDAAGILNLAAEARIHFTAGAKAASPAATAAVQLVKLTRGLPTILAANTRSCDFDLASLIVAVNAEAAGTFNNPAKLDGLMKAGIEIVARIPLGAPINPHNKRYLTTKAARSGHQFFNLKALAAENF